MPEDLQDVMLDIGEKMEKVFRFLGLLGLRRGDKYTYEGIASLLLVHSMTEGTLNNMTAKEKWTFKNELRDKFIKLAETRADDIVAMRRR